MGLKALAVTTGHGIRALAVATSENTKAALNPKKGDRKVRMTLLLVLPFLLLCGVLMFMFKESIVDMLKIMKETITYVLGIFTGGNIGEHIANGFGGKDNQSDLETGSSDSKPDEPFTP